MTERPRVVVSYSRRDSDWATWFRDQLAERGIDVWIDVADIREGERFHRSIEEAIQGSFALVVLLSPESVRSSWVDAEWQQALAQGALVIPVIIERCDVPRVLATRQILDATGDRVEAVNRVLSRIQSAWAVRDEERSGGATGVGYKAHTRQPTLNVIDALLFPFRNIHDLWRLLPLAIALTFVPPLGIILARGWRLDVVRRFAANDLEPVPRLKETGRHFGLGLMLAFLRAIFLVPALFLLLIFGAKSFLQFVWAALRWLAHAAFGLGDPISVSQLFGEYLLPALLQNLAPLGFLLLAWPVYRACIIRYALTGRASALFELHKAIALVVRHLDAFLIVFMFWLVMYGTFLAVSLPLIATGVGVIGVSGVLAPVHYYMTAYLYGALAVRIRESLPRVAVKAG
jgi:hypothetical protein